MEAKEEAGDSEPSSGVSQSIYIIKSVSPNKDNDADEYSSDEISEEDSDDANMEDSKSNRSIDELSVMSPPKSARSIKKITEKHKKPRKKKEGGGRKRNYSNNPKLLNSAQFLDRENADEVAKMTDSLNSMQDMHLELQTEHDVNCNQAASSVSAPASSAINNVRSPFDSTYNHWNQTSDNALNNLGENKSALYSEKCNYSFLFC